MNEKQHLYQWFTEPILVQKAGFTRLEIVDISQIAALTGLAEIELQEFVSDYQSLSSEHYINLITVLKAFGYEPPK